MIDLGAGPSNDAPVLTSATGIRPVTVGDLLEDQTSNNATVEQVRPTDAIVGEEQRVST